ncbi:MAG TPA: aldehyde dehydrogenase family protein [Fimbriimonadaceae bacterium]|jgi:acyl-CoA reductase-like NAD-dependent aldehyde dehydrogenase
MLHREMLIAGHFIGGPCDQAVGKVQIYAPYSSKIVGTAAEGGLDEAMAAISAAADAFDAFKNTPRSTRMHLLRQIAQLVREREEELVEVLTLEVGKPVTWSRGEVARLAITFDLAADQLSTYGFESMPLDFDPRGEGYTCRVERFPVGPIFCIVPYNWPFNLAAHKMAPALATGNTIVLKPSDLSPLSTFTLARIIHEAGCPPGVLNAILVPAPIAEKMAMDARIKMVSFTGSPGVGWHLKNICADKKVTLELGGDASAIVCEDADLDWATSRLVAGGYGYAGQVCISVQHVLAHERVYGSLKAKLIDATNACPTGDPSDPATVCGPLISSAAADKVMSFVDEAVAAGATVLAGGKREGNMVWPTLIENVPEGTKLDREEVFGPVLTLSSYSLLEHALKKVNSSQYGIQCGVFTHDETYAEQAFRTLEVGGVIIDDYPTLRFDNFPYGGVKRSGFGREGVRYAMDDMTEPKTLVTRARP